MRLIVKGDDLGWTDGVNAGFEKAARDGILTAAGAMPNMPAFERGIQLLAPYRHVSLGQHTNFVSGFPVSDPSRIPHLLNAQGQFLSTRYIRSLDQSKGDPMPYYEEYFYEIEAQVLKFIKVVGRKPAYLEGHAVGTQSSERAVADVAEKYDILHICHDGTNPYGLFCAKLGKYAMDIFKTADQFEQYTCSPEQAILEDQFGILGHETAQIFFHPGFVDADIFDASSFNGVRMRDVQALCSPAVKQWIDDHKIELINYCDLRKEAKSVAISR